MNVLRIKSGKVRVGCADNFDNPDDPGAFAVGMIEKTEVADLHAITDEISCLVIADPIPVITLFRGLLQMIYAVDAGFGF